MSVANRVVDVRECFRHTERFLLDVLPLLLLASVVVGGVVAMQGLSYLRRYDATLVFGWAASVSAFRDVGPVLLAFCLSARTGSKNAAELATMAARERLDALRALGLDVNAVVVRPRVVAFVLVAFLVYVPMCATVLAVAFVCARILGGQNLAVSAWSFLDYTDAAIVVEGCARMLVFGLAIGLTSSATGVRVERAVGRGARAIGQAVFSASVRAVSAVVVLNVVASVLGGT